MRKFKRTECNDSLNPQFWREFFKTELKLMQEEKGNGIVFSWLAGALREGEFDLILKVAEEMGLEVCTHYTGSGVVKERENGEK